MQRQRNATLIDRVFEGVTAILALLLGVVFIAAGIAFLRYQNPKVGQFGSLLAADMFLTLGVTALVGTLSWWFPRIPILRTIADDMFKKLCIVGAGLGVLFFVLLIFFI